MSETTLSLEYRKPDSSKIKIVLSRKAEDN